MITSGSPPFRAVRRILAVLPVLASLSAIGSATKLGPAVAGCAQPSSLHHAALVVEHGDGAVISACVAFAGDSITGDQLLATSRVHYATADYGTTGKAVCQIDGEPTQYPPSCWTASSPYWAMYVSRGGGAWDSSSLGVSSQTFRDGDAEGFRYEGQTDSSAPPSPLGVCPPPSTPTPIPVASHTPAARPVTKINPPAISARTPAGATAAAAPLIVNHSPPSSANPDSSPGSAASVATTSRRSPSRPASSTGALAASALGALLLVVLAVQLMRARGRRALSNPSAVRRR